MRIHDTDPDELPDFVAAWLPTQRWFANKSRAHPMRSAGTFSMESAEAGVRIQTYLVQVAAAPEPVLYQVPITERIEPLAGGNDALIAERGSRFYYDGTHDPAYTAALWRLIREEIRSPERMPNARGKALSTVDPELAYSSRVLGGEQSNTSIVYEPIGATPAAAIICKLYRVVHGGVNPDIVVQRALAALGSSAVSRPIGYVSGEWAGAGVPFERITGHLAFAQEFIRDAPDAWRVAMATARRGEEFTTRARELGMAIADVHVKLAEAMPTTEPQAESIGTMVDGMLARVRAAELDVPELAEFRTAIEAGLAAARRVPWPRLQRIHGDFHLGQVLDAPGRGWIIIDFEGEPLVPMGERGRPDCILRDLAGMLRSFSYVGGALAQAGARGDLGDWVAKCRTAFLDGYASRAGQDPREHQVLLDAFELDKAVYEARYESLNRPAWLPIPLAAIRRLAASAAKR